MPDIIENRTETHLSDSKTQGPGSYGNSGSLCGWSWGGLLSTNDLGHFPLCFWFHKAGIISINVQIPSLAPFTQGSVRWYKLISQFCNKTTTTTTKNQVEQKLGWDLDGNVPDLLHDTLEIYWTAVPPERPPEKLLIGGVVSDHYQK